MADPYAGMKQAELAKMALVKTDTLITKVDTLITALGSRATSGDMASSSAAIVEAIGGSKASTGANGAALANILAGLNAFRSDSAAAAIPKGLIDDVEALLTQLVTRADTNHADLLTLAGFTDGLEALLGTANAQLGANGAKLDALIAAASRPSPWNAVANNGALILSTTTVLLKAAAGAGLRNRVTAIQVSNLGATATLVQVLDGSSVIWSQAIGAGASAGFSVDLAGSVNTALNVKLTAAVTLGVTVNAQGYVTA